MEITKNMPEEMSSMSVGTAEYLQQLKDSKQIRVSDTDTDKKWSCTQLGFQHHSHHGEERMVG